MSAEITKIFEDVNYEVMDWSVYNFFDKKFPLLIDGRKVPVIFATPERWAQIQRDSFLKDDKGQLILPAISVRRGNTEEEINRWVPLRPETEVRRKIPAMNPDGTQKLWKGQPVYDYYFLPFPRFVNINYTITIWASYFVDINAIQQRYLSEGYDYIFEEGIHKFSGRINSISETSNNEDNTKQERIQKVEYGILLKGYLQDVRKSKQVASVNEVIITTESIENLDGEYRYSNPDDALPVRL